MIDIDNAYQTRGTVEMMQQVCRRCEFPPLVVNIGAGTGTSAHAFLDARPDALVWSIDHDLKALDAERARIGQCTRLAQICGDSRTAGLRWASGPVDVLMIDGDHSREGVSDDLDAWLPHVRKPGGWVLLHDYGQYPGVAEAVDDLLPNLLPAFLRDSLIGFQL